MKTNLSLLSAFARSLFVLFLVTPVPSILAQDCTTSMTFTLINIKGGVYSGETVTCESLDGTKFTQKSDAEGKVTFDLPCETGFNVTISNYTQTMEMMSSKFDGGRGNRSISYEPNMAEKDAFFAMSDGEKKILDDVFARMTDTTFIRNSIMPTPRNRDLYAQFTLQLRDLKNGPLADEEVCMTGQKRNLSFKGKTSKSGSLVFWLPKGDTYSLNFKYQKNFKNNTVEYTRGKANERMQLMYMGSEEHLRRIKEEEERIRREEERLKAEEAAFKAWCKRKGITEEEGHKRALAGEYPESPATFISADTVVAAVLNRNDWSEKLIVTDLTGSMNPYAGQLSAWYQLHHAAEPNLQFVFFNDGDAKSDSEKKIGSTGGIYHQKATTVEALMDLMTRVRSAGNGGDCPENNMEALIKGVSQAAPFKELVMIVDNNAPVKDIELLKEFNEPVHVILCGYNGAVLVDYLEIAWKTGGSIHTIEQDITKIAKMSEGQTLTVGGIDYKIMGGKFVTIYDN